MKTPDGRASMFGQRYLAASLDAQENNINIVMETPLEVLDNKSIREFVGENIDNYNIASDLFKQGQINPVEILNSNSARNVAASSFGHDVLGLF